MNCDLISSVFYQKIITVSFLESKAYEDIEGSITISAGSQSLTGYRVKPNPHTRSEPYANVCPFFLSPALIYI